MLSCAEYGMEAVAPQSLFTDIKKEAQKAIEVEPILAPFFQKAILQHKTLREMIAGRVAARLWTRELKEDSLFKILQEETSKIKDYETMLCADIMAVYHRDPATHRFIEPVLYLKGFLAIQAHRFAHNLWLQNRKDLSLFLQGRSSSVFQTDIHPAAKMGKGIFLDHATGFVVGETVTIGNNVSILQDVTLGGTGKECGDRHPKIADCVLIGAGAKILGNIEVGESAKIAACSVVLKAVPAHATVAGVPAKIIGGTQNEPALSMNQGLE